MKTVRGQSGLGDAMLLYPIVKEVARLNRVKVLTDHDRVFDGLAGVEVEPYSRVPVDIDCTYIEHKTNQNTDQYTDMLKEANRWYPVGAPRLVVNFRDQGDEFYKTKQARRMAEGRKVLVVTRPYIPISNKDKHLPLLADKRMFDRIVDKLRKDYFVVEVGQELGLDSKIDADISYVDKTGYQEWMSLIEEADLVLTGIGSTIIACAGLGTKCLVVYARKGLDSDNPFFSTITPVKCKFSKDTYHVIDDWTMDKVEKVLGEIDGCTNS